MTRRVPGAPAAAVIIPAYNCAATVGRAVRSALDQREAAEVVVVDDGSSDDTAAGALAADDDSGRLKVIIQSNGGPSAAVNRGQDETRAPYFCILDSDDYFLPGRLASILEFAGGDWDLAADRLLFVEEGREAGPFHPWAARLPADGRLSFAWFILGNLSRPGAPRAELGYLQPVFRRAFLDDHGLRHDETLRIGEDYVLYARALAEGARFRVVDNPGYVAVVRSQSLSALHDADDLGRWLDADLALVDLPALTAEDRAAVRRHARQLYGKLALRRALDAKAAAGRVAGLREGLRHWPALPYLVEQTVRARLPRWSWSAAPAAADAATVSPGRG
jgi:succinoglycan biosynthesis protein ExoU